MLAGGAQLKHLALQSCRRRQVVAEGLQRDTGLQTLSISLLARTAWAAHSRLLPLKVHDNCVGGQKQKHIKSWQECLLESCSECAGLHLQLLIKIQLLPGRLPLFTPFGIDTDFGTLVHVNSKYNYLQASYFKKFMKSEIQVCRKGSQSCGKYFNGTG